MNAKKSILVVMAIGLAGACAKKESDGKKESEGKKGEAAESVESRNKSRATTEARTLLKLMSNNARTYYSTPSFDGAAESLTGAITAKQFPKSAAVNPPLGDCCKNGGKCSPGAGDVWDGDSWVALSFAMVDPHYYSYQFAVAADGSSYTALAYGDLDCDGTYSTYSLFGLVVDGEVQATGDIQTVKPME